MLDDWCAKSTATRARSSARSAINGGEVDDWQAYLDAGAEHLIVMAGPPFDLEPVRKLLDDRARRSTVSSDRVRASSASTLPMRSSSGVAEPSVNSYCFSHRK